MFPPALTGGIFFAPGLKLNGGSDYISLEAPYISGATYYWYMDGMVMDRGEYMTGLDY